MKTENLETLENEIPQIFDRFAHWDWPRDGVIVVGEDDLAKAPDPFDELFTEDPTEAFGDPDSRPPFGEEEWLIGGIPDPPIEEPLNGIVDQLNESLPKGEWPGRPRRSPTRVILPDAAAFYLPWHHFDNNVWGIYLIVEGIESIGEQILALCGGWLNRGECMNVAKVFLFHHEAYHNAVETFAVRLETSHRSACYKTGMQSLYNGRPVPGIPHEEALANAYGALKVKSECFRSEKSLKVRAFKRKLSYFALLKIFQISQPPYDGAVEILKPRSTFNPKQRLFQEECLSRSLNVPRVSANVWGAALHALHPSLSRNGAFSYIIGKNHPLASKVPAGVRYFDRRKFIKRLRDEIGGELEGGGRHQIYKTPDGLRVPIPTGDLKIGTADSILKSLGLKSKYKSVKNFLIA